MQQRVGYSIFYPLQPFVVEKNKRVLNCIFPKTDPIAVPLLHRFRAENSVLEVFVVVAVVALPFHQLPELKSSLTMNHHQGVVVLLTRSDFNFSLGRWMFRDRDFNCQKMTKQKVFANRKNETPESDCIRLITKQILGVDR